MASAGFHRLLLRPLSLTWGSQRGAEPVEKYTDHGMRWKNKSVSYTDTSATALEQINKPEQIIGPSYLLFLLSGRDFRQKDAFSFHPIRKTSQSPCFCYVFHENRHLSAELLIDGLSLWAPCGTVCAAAFRLPAAMLSTQAPCNKHLSSLRMSIPSAFPIQKRGNEGKWKKTK